jgi:CO dehydrogenase nickel-insertion accessory protein CooC1
MRGRWGPVNAAIRQALNAISLEEMQEAIIPHDAGTHRFGRETQILAAE